MQKLLRCKSAFLGGIIALLLPFLAVAQCPITTFPHTENFNAVTPPAMPCGWTTLNVNNDAGIWATVATNPNSPPNALRYNYNTTNAADDWAFSPSITMTAGTQYQLTFRYRVESATFPEALEVKFGTAATVAGMTTTLFTNSNLTNITYATATATITPTANGTYFLGFHAISLADQFNLYVDDIAILAPCTGTPVAGTVPATLGICPGTASTITATGATVAGGIVYQWEQATSATGPWTNVVGGSGATTTTYTLPTTLTATTFYRLNVTCSTNPTATSSAVQVTINPPAACYCSTNLHGVACSATDNINTVTIAGTTLNNANTGCSATTGMGYTAYPAAGATTATLLRQTTYNLSVTSTANSIMSVWIDYNQSGTFEASEWTQIATTSTAGTAVTIPITIPNTAVLGQTGMRIRSRLTSNANGATDACSTFGSGETEDYFITIGAAPTCTTPVTAGTITGILSVCSGQTSTLSLTGQTLGTSLQWQSSPDGTTWTDITGANNSNFTTPVITANTFYRVNVTCGTSTVPTASVQVALNTGAISTFPHTQNFDGVTPPAMPCGWTTLNVNNDAGIWATVASSPSTPPNALRYNYNTTNAANDWAFSPAITMNSANQYLLTFKYRVESASFPEALEVKLGSAATVAGMTTTLFTNSNLTNITYATATATITPTATGSFYIGFHAMSLANQWNIFIDDFTITELAPCTGTPVAGTVPTGPIGICPGTGSTITATGATVAGGIVYQWEQATSATGPWTNVVGGSGATTTTYTLPTTLTATTFYRLKVTCGTTNFATTSAVQVTINPPAACYCSTNLHGVACSATDNINTVTIAGTTLNNANTGCSATTGMGYTAYPAAGATTATLLRQTTYNLSVTSTANSIMSVWIDYNQSGTFEASEWTQIATTSTAGTAVTIPITIPNTAVLGQTGMRIRSRAFGNTNGAADACSTFGSGETEDYIVTIAPACATAIPTLTAGGPTTFCTGGSVTLTAASTTTGATYQWFNNGTAITGATAATYNATTAGSYTAVANANSCNSVPSTATTVTVNAIPATPTITQNGGTLTSSATTGNQWYLNGTLIPGATGRTYVTTANGNYTVISTANGCPSATSAIRNVTNTGMKDAMAGMSVEVYPNPATGSFNVKLTGYQKDATVVLYNLAGQQIATNEVAADGKAKNISLKGLAAGTYLLKVTSENGVQVNRLIVQ